MLIYPNTNLLKASNYDNPIFLEVEKEFDNFIDTSNPANEYFDKYFGEYAIYSKEGAILGAIEYMIDEANETGKPVNVNTFDLAALFEG